MRNKATAIYNKLRYEKIVETNSCPCEIEHPSWDDADEKYIELTAGRTLDEIPELRDEISRDVRKNLKASLDICKAWRGQ